MVRNDILHFSDIEPFLSVSKLEKRIDSTLLLVIEVLAIRYTFERLGSDLRQLGGPLFLYLTIFQFDWCAAGGLICKMLISIFLEEQNSIESRSRPRFILSMR